MLADAPKRKVCDLMARHIEATPEDYARMGVEVVVPMKGYLVGKRDNGQVVPSDDTSGFRPATEAERESWIRIAMRRLRRRDSKP